MAPKRKRYHNVESKITTASTAKATPVFMAPIPPFNAHNISVKEKSIIAAAAFIAAIPTFNAENISRKTKNLTMTQPVACRNVC